MWWCVPLTKRTHGCRSGRPATLSAASAMADVKKSRSSRSRRRPTRCNPATMPEVKTWSLRHQLSDDDVKPLAGHELDERHYDLVVRDSTAVYRPDGALLLVYLQDVLPHRLCRLAF